MLGMYYSKSKSNVKFKTYIYIYINKPLEKGFLG